MFSPSAFPVRAGKYRRPVEVRLQFLDGCGGGSQPDFPGNSVNKREKKILKKTTHTKGSFLSVQSEIRVELSLLSVQYAVAM